MSKHNLIRDYDELIIGEHYELETVNGDLIDCEYIGDGEFRDIYGFSYFTNNIVTCRQYE